MLVISKATVPGPGVILVGYGTPVVAELRVTHTPKIELAVALEFVSVIVWVEPADVVNASVVRSVN